MRLVVTLLAALSALLMFLPNGSDAQTAPPLNWYRLVSSDDGKTAYLWAARSIDTEIPDRKIAIFMTTRVGPSEIKGVFGELDSVFFQCTDGTMGPYSYTQYTRTGQVADTGTLTADQVKFQPVDMGGQYGLAFKVVCQGLDPSVLPTTGNVTMPELMEADIAAYDRKTGRTFAY